MTYIETEPRLLPESADDSAGMEQDLRSFELGAETLPQGITGEGADYSPEEKADRASEFGSVKFTEFDPDKLRSTKLRDKAFFAILSKYNHHPTVLHAMSQYRQPSLAGYDPNDELTSYLNITGRSELLTVDGERELFGVVETGLATYQTLSDIEQASELQEEEFIRLAIAYQKIYASNVRLVISIAKKFPKNRGTASFGDLIQEGNIGLGEAIRRFDVTKNIKFSVFAFSRIRSHIQHAMVHHDRQENRRHWLSVTKSLDFLTMVLRRTPSTLEIADDTGLTVDEVSLLTTGLNRVTSLNAYASDSGSMEIGDMIRESNNGEDGLLAFADNDEIQSLVDNALLDDKERAVLRLSYGVYIDGIQGENIKNRKLKTVLSIEEIFGGLVEDSRTLEEVGRLLGFTRGRIHQILNSALSKLRSVVAA